MSLSDLGRLSRGAARRVLGPIARPARRVTRWLSGYGELRSQIEGQQDALRRLDEWVREAARDAVRELVVRQESLARDLSARIEARADEERAARDVAARRVEERDASLRGALVAAGAELAALRVENAALRTEIAALRAETPAAVKAAEAALNETLVGEVDRLDGYLLFHASELRGALADLDRRLSQSAHFAAVTTPPLSKAG